MTVDMPLDWREFFAEYRSAFGDVRAITKRRRSIPDVSPNMFTPEVLDVFVFDSGMVEVSTGLIPVLGERPRRERRGVGLSVWVDGEPDPSSRLVHGDGVSIWDVRREFDAVADTLQHR